MIPILKSHKIQNDLSNKVQNVNLEEIYSDMVSLDDNGNVQNSHAKSVIDWLGNKIVINKKIYTFKDIVFADFNTLIKIKEYLNSKPSIKKDKSYKSDIEALYSSRLDRVKFINTLEITVCPYCNRNFVNTLKERTMCQFDHFINKSEYPLFFVSFFNLVPVCASCNHIKRTNDFNYSPHDINFTANQLLTFSYELKGGNLTNTNDFEITISDINPIISENVDKLHLLELFQINKDVVSDLYRKSLLCNDSFIDMIYNIDDKLFSSRDELRQLIIGTYIEENEYGKRPLAKLTNDIAKEFNLINTTNSSFLNC